MGKNLYRKVIEKHTVARLPSGNLQLFIGAHFLHEVTSPQAFAMLRGRGLSVRCPQRTFAAADHVVPTHSLSRPYEEAVAEEMMSTLEQNVRDAGIRFFAPDSDEGGIVHVIGPENGISQPGMTIACGDSHTATHGALGAVAFGIGTSQVRDVLATQTLGIEPLKVREIRVEGSLARGVYPKDLILYVIRTLGVKGGVGYAYEFSGPAVEAMSMDGRLTLCNMAIEGGARVGYVNPDRVTYDYLKNRPFSPSANDWDRAVAYWESVRSDPDAVFEDRVEFSAGDIEPMVTWGITPGQSVFVNESIPALDTVAPEERDFVREAFEYMGLGEGDSVRGMPVDVAFIGSCTNGRLSDFQAAAEVLKGRKVRESVRALAVPGSRKVKKQAEEAGLDRIFIDAGFEWREAGCSMCLAMNPDRLSGRQVSASSSNRNFKGRQGSAAGRTLLMSPAMVASAAVTGEVSDVREFL
jgi:3-isopropylmalate/(R)-2-methylmalate dehydratase large subunit